MTIRDNLEKVNAMIEEAKRAAGRSDGVTLVAVTKYSTPEDVLEAARCGQRVFAENRVQMLLEKQNALAELKARGEDVPAISWHLIGHLQTNKVKYIIGKVDLIHSCDSLRLAREISARSVKAGVTTAILIEVNVSGEESKSGVTLEEAEPLVRECAALPGITVKGLMTMAPLGSDEAEQRKIFHNLCEKYVDIGKKNIYNANMTVLSRGMSSDFQCAIECGANMVRLGHIIFDRC